jgi:hypothetical protein
MGGVHWVTLTYLFLKKFQKIATNPFMGWHVFCRIAFDKNVAIYFSLSRKLNFYSYLARSLNNIVKNDHV